MHNRPTRILNIDALTKIDTALQNVISDQGAGRY
jgi:hypothetical protein